MYIKLSWLLVTKIIRHNIITTKRLRLRGVNQKTNTDSN